MKDAIATWIARRHPASATLAADLAAARLAGHTAQPVEGVAAAALDPLLAEGLVVRAGAQIAWAACAVDEHAIAERLRVLAAVPVGRIGPAQQALIALGEDADQDAAVETVVRRRLAVITGGPGTGKTSTVLRALAALLAGQKDLRIAVCAPTGKAAARLRAAMERGLTRLPQRSDALARAAAAATTVHRLLGWEAREARFRHRASRPLACDVVVVDEASMLDIHLAAALCRALPATARLVLVGDDGQLPSVEAGALLRDVVEGCADRRALAGCQVRLRTVHRQAEAGGGLRALAPALREGDADAVAGVLAAGHPDIGAVAHADAWPLVRGRIEPWARTVVEAVDPAAALLALETCLVLCTTRQGPWSVADLHRRIEGLLGGQPEGEEPLHRHGRPLLVTANDHRLGLANGDLGVFWDEGGLLMACFPDGQGGVRRLAPARLPACVTGWAVTVHKAQGSEAAEAIAVLPPQAHPLANRELLYTAVTRARRNALIVGDAGLIAQAIARREERRTLLGGLLERPRTADTPPP